ncbi:hypothetical protein BBF96_02310 [Anoxybacter fermentans]|uniref:Segregation and condensation protein A n=1 Tax=Anoxybacter fermentans TaxID=1323375 RepID=A0A3S9SVJ2_9FIRM|nr:segregation/condensation protein A [Anoxybacter fermentans]AZR72326.1 hypothetical protein BBF96_02310 [Anoxybacter fermentans]
MEYQVNLGFFEGPLDLLFHLVKKNKLEINNISLAAVTEQYLAYIRKMQELDLDFAGDFLVTAAQLMELKSRTLLPSYQEKGDDKKAQPHELVTKLLEYKKFKELASQLREREENRGLFFTRDNEKLIDEIVSDLPEFNPLENVTLDDFREAFIKALRDAAKREKALKEAKEDDQPEFRVEEISIKDKLLELEAIIEESSGWITFGELFSTTTSRIEVVVTFLALLELIKLKKIKVSQNQLYGEILICREG